MGGHEAEPALTWTDLYMYDHMLDVSRLALQAFFIEVTREMDVC